MSFRTASIVSCTCALAVAAGCGGTGSGAERQWAYQGQRGVTVVLEPADGDLYRDLLPSPFDVPARPLVLVAVVSYYDVTAPLVPYHEGYVLLSCEYKGRAGWYTLTMPVDDQTANDAGRFIGFPKYVADRIELLESGGAWGGEVAHDGHVVLQVEFTPVSLPVESGGPPSQACFNLSPPAEGPEIVEVNTAVVKAQRVVTVGGTALVTSEADEPWVELLEGATTVSAQFAETTGEWILEWKRL
jgi:hypothetical protein